LSDFVMTDETGDTPKDPKVRVARAKSFDGYVILENDRIVAIALSRGEADTLLQKILKRSEPPSET
jgi:hypothetical protein